MPEKPLVIVSHRLPEEWLASLNGVCEVVVGPETAVTTALSPELRAHLPQADGLLTMLTVPVDAALLASAPGLRVVSNMAVGVDNIDLAACTRVGIPVGHTPGVLTDGTADLVMALVLAAARRLPEAVQDARHGRWTTWSPTGWLGKDLAGATFGIIGLGQIGQAVARRARGFGVTLVYHARSRHFAAEAELGAVWLPLDALLATSDFVVVLVPLTAETRHLINADALRLMQPTALLVNAARGPVVDSNALLTALREGWIGGAALDVTDPEPLPSDHPLYAQPNCLITPHIGSATQATRREMADLACRNLLAGVRGERLVHCVNPEVYGNEE